MEGIKKASTIFDELDRRAVLMASKVIIDSITDSTKAVKDTYKVLQDKFKQAFDELKKLLQSKLTIMPAATFMVSFLFLGKEKRQFDPEKLALALKSAIPSPLPPGISSCFAITG